MKLKLNLASLLVACLGLIAFQARSEPYLLHTSGTMVLDKATSLVWMRCTYGQVWTDKSCIGEKKEFTIDFAKKTVTDLNLANGFGGYSDWAIPKVSQFSDLVDCFGNSKMVFDYIPVTIQGEAKNPALQFYCAGAKMGNEFINMTAFPSTQYSAYWTSSRWSADIPDAWTFSFYHGSVSLPAGYHDTRQLLLVRGNRLTDDATVAGFTQAIPSGIEIFRTNQKYK